MNICLQSSKNTSNRIFLSSLLLASCALTSANHASASQNSVLAEIGSAPADWKNTDLQLMVNDTAIGDTPSVNLGETVSIKLSNPTQANHMLVVINTYGDVKLIKPVAGDSSATHQFEASAPVGQYSLFAFSSDIEIQTDQLNAPIGQYIFQASDAEQAVKSVINALTSSGKGVSMSPEFRFSIDDGNLAHNTRSLEKKMRKLKSKKPSVPRVATAPSTPAIVVAAVEPLVEIPKNKAPEIPKVEVPQVELSQVKLVQVVESSVIVPSESTESDSLSLDIKFQLNSGDLTQAGINQLDSLGSVLVVLQRSDSMPTIMLEGHTDDSGSADYNLYLSKTRANAARDYLLERFELPAASVEATGLGESAPKTLNTSPSGRKENRRVELRIVQ